ncbi:hypothetical protein [Neomoorella thermoacetica]|uniref:hypothetical protein n=1 Tax=Neomoorella thermoacetica TaxID=1525 RepID=UPI0008FB6906|nr:hypothetical protein [Moorella thermoacetica]APC08288.1 hypothetical protein MTJW_11220 [Moorella thermoacetica]
MEILDAAVGTILKLLAGDLPAPEPGKKQAGVGGWYYSFVDVGGDTPPPGKRAGGKPAELWWLEWYGGRPITPAEKLQKQIQGIIDAGNNGDYWQLYVAQHRGLLHWWFRNLEGVKIKTTSSVKLLKPQGDLPLPLPLIFATRKTSLDNVKVQAGIALYQQKWQDEAFVEWLRQWVVRIVGKDEANLVTTKLLQEYTPVSGTIITYLRRTALKRQNTTAGAFKNEELTNEYGVEMYDTQGPTEIQDAAIRLGVSERTLYYLLEKYGEKFGCCTINRREYLEDEDGPVVIRERRSYTLTPEVIEELKKIVEEKWAAKEAAKKAKLERMQARKFHAMVVDSISRYRNTCLRAAQRLVKRRLDAGKTLEEIFREEIDPRWAEFHLGDVLGEVVNEYLDDIYSD